MFILMTLLKVFNKFVANNSIKADLAIFSFFSSMLSPSFPLKFPQKGGATKCAGFTARLHQQTAD